MKSGCELEALRFGHPPPRMSSGWRFARASPFISLRETPKSQHLKLMACCFSVKSLLRKQAHQPVAIGLFLAAK